jgi:hypothetical protein
LSITPKLAVGTVNGADKAENVMNKKVNEIENAG